MTSLNTGVRTHGNPAMRICLDDNGNLSLRLVMNLSVDYNCRCNYTIEGERDKDRERCCLVGGNQWAVLHREQCCVVGSKKASLRTST